MYITDFDGIMLINIDLILYIDRNNQEIVMQDGTRFKIKQSEFDEILTELERR